MANIRSPIIPISASSSSLIRHVTFKRCRKPHKLWGSGVCIVPCPFFISIGRGSGCTNVIWRLWRDWKSTPQRVYIKIKLRRRPPGPGTDNADSHSRPRRISRFLGGWAAWSSPVFERFPRINLLLRGFSSCFYIHSFSFIVAVLLEIGIQCATVYSRSLFCCAFTKSEWPWRSPRPYGLLSGPEWETGGFQSDIWSKDCSGSHGQYIHSHAAENTNN
jgi:hypothetical protein